MDSESEQELCVGDVVWCPINGCPKWPCKIEEVGDEFVEALSFGDNASVSVKLGRVQKFSNDDQTKLLIKKGRQSCKNRPDTLKMFNSSIAEALTVIRESNPEFSFEYGSLDDSTHLPNTPSSPVVTSTPASRSRYGRAVKAVTPLVAEPISDLKRRSSKRLNDQSSIDLPLDQLTDNSYGTTISSKRKRTNDHSESENKRFATNHECSLDDLVKNSIATNDTIDMLHSSSDSVVENLSKKFQDSQNEPSLSEDASTPLTTSHDPLITTDSSPDIPQNTSCVNISSTASNKETPVPSDDSGSGCGLGRSFLSSSKESDDLPECDFGDSVLVSDIRPNDIVWAKFRRYPYWPAIVDCVQVEKKSKSSSVQKRRKSTPAKSSKKNNFKVYFLAYNDDHSLKVPGEKNILKYNYKNNDKLKKDGKAYPLKEFESKLFELAIKEAEDLIRLRIQGEVTGPPKAQMNALQSRRPKEYDDIKIEPSSVEDEESSKPAASAFGYDIGDTQKELFGNEEETSSDGEWVGHEDEQEDHHDNDSPYNLKNVLEILNDIKDELISISKGDVESKLHNIFHNGLRKERGELKLLETFGPVKLRENEQHKVITFLQETVKEILGEHEFHYIYNVLLPEAMVRVVKEVDHCSIEKAWRKFSS